MISIPFAGLLKDIAIGSDCSEVVWKGRGFGRGIIYSEGNIVFFVLWVSHLIALIRFFSGETGTDQYFSGETIEW